MRGAHPCSGATSEGHAGDRRSRAPKGGCAGAAPAAGHWARMSGRNRATWQDSGLESPVCFLSLQIIEGFISLEIKLENIRKCLALTRLERGRGAYFGIVGRVLCFEVIITKFVAQKFM